MYQNVYGTSLYSTFYNDYRPSKLLILIWLAVVTKHIKQWHKCNPSFHYIFLELHWARLDHECNVILIHVYYHSSTAYWVWGRDYNIWPHPPLVTWPVHTKYHAVYIYRINCLSWSPLSFSLCLHWLFLVTTVHFVVASKNAPYCVGTFCGFCYS